MGFWITDLIKEVTTPRQPAFSFAEYIKAVEKYGEKTALQMRKNGCFNIKK